MYKLTTENKIHITVSWIVLSVACGYWADNWVVGFIVLQVLVVLTGLFKLFVYIWNGGE